MANLFGESEDAGSHIPDALPTHISPTVRKFLPWHRVHKEFIRKKQWSELAVRLADGDWKGRVTFENKSHSDAAEESEAERQDGQTTRQIIPINCLFIPGDDLLDVRALYRDLKPLGCYIKYLGFNERGGSDKVGTRVHVANNAVTAQQRVLKDSLVLPDRFERIASRNSQAWSTFKKYGPYHIVNLDFCGSLLPTQGSSDKGYLEAIHSLLAYQFEHQRARWLMFVTTEVEPGAIDADSLMSFCSATRSNFDDHPDFADRLSSIIPPNAFGQPSPLVNLSVLSAEEVISLFGVSFGKWLIKLCHTASPKWTVEMRRSFRYEINAQHGSVMLALAFEFRQNFVPPTDPSGISSLSLPTRTYPDECASGIKMIESVSNMKDADEQITELGLFDQLRDEQAALLEIAGYDRNSYLEWVAAGQRIEDSP